MFVLTETARAVQGNTDPAFTVVLAIEAVALVSALVYVIVKAVRKD